MKNGAWTDAQFSQPTHDIEHAIEWIEEIVELAPQIEAKLRGECERLGLNPDRWGEHNLYCDAETVALRVRESTLLTDLELLYEQLPRDKQAEIDARLELAFPDEDIPDEG